MYATRELRWFFKEDVPFITKWFRQNCGMTFAKTEARQDFYLPQPGKSDSGIKLREGNFEVKTRKGKARLIKINENCAGYMESWEKWSFGVKPSDELANTIVEKNKYNWLKTTKTRMGFKIVKIRGGAAWRNIKDELQNGCQVEYTLLKIKNDTWYTLAVENFGNTNSNLYDPVLSEIAAAVSLPQKNSMGYPEFLNKYCF